MANILYVRVSTKEQETARQEELTKQYKIDKVFIDKATGKNTDRPQFKAMMLYLREGDTLYVESISRLSRSIRDLLRTVDELEEKKVKFVSVKECIDTSTPQGKFMLSIFGALAELEREQMLQRQAEEESDEFFPWIDKNAGLLITFFILNISMPKYSVPIWIIMSRIMFSIDDPPFKAFLIISQSLTY